MNIKKFKKTCSKGLSLILAALISASACSSIVMADETEISVDSETTVEYEQEAVSKSESEYSFETDSDYEIMAEEEVNQEETGIEEIEFVSTSEADHASEETTVTEAYEEENVSSEMEPETSFTEISVEETEIEMESEESDEDIYGLDDYDFSSLSGLDFSSMRLIISSDNEEIFKDEKSIIASYDGIYLLQFADTETAMKAYVYYQDKASIVEIDTGIQVCDEAYAEENNSEVMMTEEDNPLSELAEAISYGSATYDVALIDTGADNTNIIGAVSVIGENASDDNGHGTRMAEYMVSENSDISILSIKAFDSNGKADISAVYAAVEYAISQNVKVINLSASAYAANENLILREAVNDAVNAGITFVGSAGNNGKNASFYVPGNISNAFIVGAADENGVTLATSNFGETVDVNVVAGSTSEAAARMSGWLSAHDMTELESIMNDGFVYETGYEPETDEDPDEEDASFNINATWPKQNSNSISGITLNWSIEWSGMDAWWESPNGAITFDNNWSCLGTISKISDLKSGDVVLWWDDYEWSWVNHIAIVTEVASDGSYFITADGNTGSSTGVGINTRTNFSKRGSTYGKLLVWRNSVNGAAIGSSAAAFTQTMLTNNDTSMSSQWSNINWCYCFVVSALLSTTPQYGALKVTKTTSLPAGSLKISKTTDGTDVDKATDFTFNLKVTNASGAAVSTKFSYSKSDGTTGTISGNGGTIKLKNGQNVVISGIPQGYGYTVTETSNTKYSTTVSKNGASASKGTSVSGTIPAGSTNQAFTFTVNIKNGSSNVSGLTVASGLTTDSNGNVSFTLKPGTSGSASKTLSNIPAGYKYTITETKASGWTADKTTASGNITSGSTASATFKNTYNPSQEIAAFTNTRSTTSLKIVKTTSSTGICKSELNGNGMYSQDFSGAVFSVKIWDENKNAWGSAKSYTTGSDGTVTINGLYVGGKVQVTETKAPAGYVIPESATQEITLAENSNKLTFKDDPTFDPGTPTINKVKYVNGKIVKGEAVEGAVFKMEYFDNTDCSGSAVRTWYFKTDSTGTFNYSKKYIASDYASDDLYVNINNDPDLPLGSIMITEVSSPKGYKLYEGTLKGKVTQNTTNGLAEFSWITESNGQILVESDGSVTFADDELVIGIDKIDSNTERPVKGAKLQILEGNKVVAEWTTDGNTKLIKNTLELGKTYTLHEVTAPEDYETAADIEFSIAADGTITVTTGNVNTYITSDGYLAIKMEDVKKIELPVTGSKGGMTMIIIGCLLFAGGCCSAVVISRRKKGYVEE